MSDLATSIVKQLESQKSLRQPHEQTWKRCYQYTHPLRASGFDGTTITADDAQAEKARQTDSTATDAVRIVTSQIVSGLTPANSLWFDLEINDQTDVERRWLRKSAETIWKNIHGANFDSVAFEGTIDGVDAGWFVIYVDEAETGGYNFELWPLAECFVTSSKDGGIVDTIYRCFKLTAEQAVSKYGEDAVSDDIRKAYEDKKADAKFEFVHAIYPRKIYAVGSQLAKNLPLASCHVEVGKKHLVRESGYNEFPCAVPRWMLIPGTCYGVGLVFDALPDIAMLNEIKRFELQNLEMAIAGTFVAEDDGVLNPKTVNIGPRKIIIANSVDSIKPLTSSGDFNVGFMAEERIQAQIRKILLADQLQPQDGPAMTATEVHVRVNLIRQLLGPIYGRLQAEYLKPLIERCFGIAYRAGALGPAPESLGNRDIAIKYTSPLARAQKLQEVTAIDQYVAGLVSVSVETQDPSIMDNVDLDAAAKFKADALGVPPDIVPSDDAIKARREARVKAQQQQMQQEQAMQLQSAAGEAAIKKSVGVQ